MGSRNYELLSISAAAANLRERVTLAAIERGAHEPASLGHGWPPLFLRHLVPYLFFELLSCEGDGCCHFLHDYDYVGHSLLRNLQVLPYKRYL